MLNSEVDQTVLDFPLSQVKPGHYSDREVPKVPAFTTHSDNLNQKPESVLDKVYQISTSLPVSSALLAAVTSQGVPVGGSLWYLNYSAILVILLTAVALVISYLSTSASHNYCETIFLTIYTPASQLFNITLNFRDVHQMEDSTTEQPSTTRQATPSWFKQFLFVCISLAATQGLSVVAVVYAFSVTLVYSLFSAQLRKYNKGDVAGTQKPKIVLTNTDYLCMGSVALSVITDLFINPTVGLSHLFYFILVDKNTVAAIKTAVENRGIEIMEGLEQHYTEGLGHLAQISLTLAAIFAQPSFCLLYIPVFYFCVYQPIQQFRLTVRAINSESLCMSNFEKATASDIKQYDDVCAVCLCAMKHARITPCKHIFHGKCLKDCLKKKVQCPMCNNHML